MNNLIIHPTDFSKCSMVAFEYAINVAQHYHYELLLVHSIDQSKLDDFDQAGHSLLAKSEEIEKEAELKLRDLGNQVTKLGIECKAKLYSGAISSWLPRLIKEENPYLVIMGTTGAGSIGNKFFGSNANTIMQTSTSPVLAVPASASYKSLKTIALATDLEKIEQDVFQFMNDFASKLESLLQLVYVSSEVKSDYGNEVMTKVKSIFENFETSVEVEYKMILNDNYIYGISDYVLQNRPDLLAIIMTNKNFIEKFLFGSLSDKMIHYSDAPLMVIPPNLRK